MNGASQNGTEALTCVGLMSGTSVDGIDVAIVRIVGRPPQLTVDVLHEATVPFSEAVRAKIFALFDLERAKVAELSDMNFLLGAVFADAVLEVLAQAGIAREEIAFISSHGQTIYHNPVPQEIAGVQVTSTLQIGEASVIAEKTGIPVISDFRVRDMAAGGQGAPLVPFVDALLFAKPGQGRILANIGGIANLTVLGDEPVLAFDTGPGNMIVDGLVQRLTDGREVYDRDGKLARSGRVLEEYLQKWMALPYFSQRPPKSTGRELFGQACVQQWWQDGLDNGFAPVDLVATATEFTVRTFCQAIRKFVLPHQSIAEVIVGGGGAYNPVFLERMQELLPEQKIMRQDAMGISSAAKEAVAFAVLGYECYHQRPNNLTSATGADHPVVMGKIVWR